MSSRQDNFFEAVAARQIPRIRVAGIVVHDGAVLVQKPTDDADACYAFIGGEYETGDTFESRLKKEFEEETNATVLHSTYLFCVENHFEYKGMPIQQIEHYFDVTLDRADIESLEDHLMQYWLPLADLQDYDLRPLVVRDALQSGTYLDVKRMTQAGN